jgi:SpoU rRNA methylase family enzyme
MRWLPKTITAGRSQVNGTEGADVPNTYLVIEPEQIVAQDLALAIRSSEPGSNVLVVRDLHEAAERLEHLRPRAIFLHEDPERLRNELAARFLSGIDAPLVFLGTLAETRSAGEIVLETPFTEASVEAALRRVLNGAAGQDAGV